MKQLLPVVFFSFLLACNSPQQGKQDKGEKSAGQGITKIEFDNEMHNIGIVQAGEIVVYTFVFTNTGENDLVIKNVKTDCGCVNALVKEKPVKPGEKGLIELEFDSSGLFGKQFKTITVEANIKEPKHLAIFADVNNDQLKIKY